MGPTTIADPSSDIAELRLIKSDAEIAQMKFAADVSSIAHIAAMRHGGIGSTENQIQSVIEGSLDMLELQAGLTLLLWVVAKMLQFCTIKRTKVHVKMVM